MPHQHGLSGAACSACGWGAPDARSWRCERCAGVLERPPPRVDLGAVEEAEGLWRYRAWLGADAALSLGEPRTPLVAVDLGGLAAQAKLEGALPSGSFKDRGAAILVSALAACGVEAVVEDSSGNAGAALAAYCARAGLGCTLYVAEAASPAKVAQARAYGATVVRVPGSRAAAAEAALEAAANGAVYASHAWNPFYQDGTATFAFELWEQLGRRSPDVLVLPLGGGSLLLGAQRGFAALRAAGLVDAVPALVGVQAAACAPLADAWAAGGRVAPGRAGRSAADGILIERPVRAAAVLEAVRASGGAIVAVGEAEIAAAQRLLAHAGIYAEPTAAVGAAGLASLGRRAPLRSAELVVLAVTGTGLKAAPA